MCIKGSVKTKPDYPIVNCRGRGCLPEPTGTILGEYANQPIFGRANLALTSKMIAEFLKYVFTQPQTMTQSCEAF